jgi:hypothetical protein
MDKKSLINQAEVKNSAHWRISGKLSWLSANVEHCAHSFYEKLFSYLV